MVGLRRETLFKHKQVSKRGAPNTRCCAAGAGLGDAAKSSLSARTFGRGAAARPATHPHCCSGVVVVFVV